MIPRLPVYIPRFGIATMSPNGVARFCKGIWSGSNCRRDRARPRVDRQEPVETEQLLEERGGLQQRRLAARLADELQADWPAELIETARNGHRGTGGKRDHRRDRRAAHVVVELLAADRRGIAQIDVERWRWRARRHQQIVGAKELDDAPIKCGPLAFGAGNVGRRLRKTTLGVPNDVGFQLVAMTPELQFAVDHEMLAA